MRDRKVSEYPDILKELTIKMLANENLFNIFMHLVLNKTNLHNPDELIVSIELMD